MIETEAWVLRPAPAPAQLQRQTHRFAYDEATEVLVAPLWGCWEANMDHALDRQPIDVCAFRGDDKVVLGNGGVVRVLNPGPRQDLKPGDICLFLSFGPIAHAQGFPRSAHGYDAPGTVGLLARTSKCLPHQLVVLPADTPPDQLRRWSAFALRYVTAWANWEVAHGVYRVLQPEHLPVADKPWVVAWGGGVALATLQLAQAAGFNVAMFSGRPARQAQLRQAGIAVLTRHADPRAMKQQIREVTGGQGASIFVDLIGEPVMGVTLSTLACPGVLTTAGWKEGMQIKYQRALACMQWQSFVHTHYARPDQALAAVAYAQRHDWLPELTDEPVWSWSDVPALATAYREGLDSYFPLYAVNAL